MASKNKNYKTSFSDNFKEQFPFVTKCSSHVSDHQHKFHCTICNVKISPAHGGSDDITRHAETPGHIKQSSALKGKRIFHSLSAGIYLPKVNNRNTRTRCEICSKLTIKTPERRLASFWCLYC